MLDSLFANRSADRNFPVRRRARDRNIAILVLTLVGVFVVLLAQLGEDGLATFLNLQQDEDELAAEVQRLEDANAELEQQLQGLATDPAVLEKRAREEHNMQKPGEEVLTVREAQQESR